MKLEISNLLVSRALHARYNNSHYQPPVMDPMSNVWVPGLSGARGSSAHLGLVQIQRKMNTAVCLDYLDGLV